LCDGSVGQRGEGEGESDTSADHDPVPFECFALSKDTAGVSFGAKELGASVWSLGGGIAILWVDVLEGAINR